MFVQLALTSPNVDLGAAGFVPLVMEAKRQVLAAFDELAAKLPHSRHALRPFGG